MREDQLFRRLTYIAIGALPAVLLTVATLFLAGPLTNIGAIVGTLGLCAATFVRLPPDSPNFDGPIAVALIIGLMTCIAWMSFFVFVYVSGFVEDRAADDFNSTRGLLTSLGSALYTCWILIGPIAIALHFLFSLNRHRASNN